MTLARQLLCYENMNLVFILVVIAVIGGVFWFQKHSDSGHAADTRAKVNAISRSMHDRGGP